MAKKQFKAESKRLLDMMIHSIYSQKEVFLRELISNASDALDKLHFRSLTDSTITQKKEDYRIDITVNKDARMLTIKDSGAGMLRDELEANLGTIAKSGSLDFKQTAEAGENMDIIGQFGIGFYSAFMVADKVTVNSRAYGANEAYSWESKGADGYTINPCEKADFGTEIILVIKENTDEENYENFLDKYTISSLVKKYSDYIRYPIYMETETSVKKEDSDEYETITELSVLNSMTPIWKKDKKDVAEEEYAGFYQDKFADYTPPAKVMQSKTEGSATYTALLFIPGRTPFDYYTKNYEKGLQLYASGVLIMEKCADLLPEYFGFVRGLVDSQDLSLNISREMLQQDNQVKLIRNSLERKIKAELAKMLKDEREGYEEFFKNFGMQLKAGIYADFGMNKELLKDLLLYYSINTEKMVTLQEYRNAMPEEQPYIYYATGESAEKINRLPQAETVKGKGYDILCLTDDIDEFVINILDSEGDKEFRSISGGDLGLESEEEKQELQTKAEEHKDLFAFMKTTLNGKVTDVRLSQRLVTHPVCLTAEGALSIEMEKVLNSMPSADKISAEKVLEINMNHPVFETLQTLLGKDDEKLKQYTALLYNQALLIEGLPIEDPVQFAVDICELMK